MSSTMVLFALTTRLLVALPAMSPPIRKNVSCTEIGLPAWLAVEPGRADGQQGAGVGRARVEQQAVDPDAVHVGDLHGVHAVVRDEGREADAEHDRVRVGDVERLVDVVDAGGEEQVAALGQRRVDLRGGVRRGGHEELAHRQRGAGGRAAGPAGAGRVGPQAGHEHVVVAGGVDVEVRDVARDRGGGQRGHRRAGEALGGRAGHAGEHHVPDRAAPAAEVAVRGVPLLLRARSTPARRPWCRRCSRRWRSRSWPGRAPGRRARRPGGTARPGRRPSGRCRRTG